jgi:hypothetical protein
MTLIQVLMDLKADKKDLVAVMIQNWKKRQKRQVTIQSIQVMITLVH